MIEQPFLDTIEEIQNSGPWLVYADWLEEHGETSKSEEIRHYFISEEKMLRLDDAVVGDHILIETVTLYYIGRIVKINLGSVKLEQCSWVHRTGRLSELHSTLDFSKMRSLSRVKTEYVVEKTITNHSIVSYRIADWVLPERNYPL